MVTFSLGDIFGQPVDTSETRRARLEITFAMLVAAVMDLRFDDARQHLSEIGAEIDDLDTITKPYQEGGEG